MVHDVENIAPIVVQNINDATTEEIVAQQKYCNMLKKRKFGGVNCNDVDNVTIVQAEIELNKVKLIYTLIF